MSLKIFNKKLLLIAQITIFALLLVNSETNKSLGEDAITPTSSQVNSIASETTPTNPANSASSNPASPSPATTTTENKDANPDEKLTPKENIIYIPYEKFNRNFGVNNGGVFVPYDEY
ncbi:MAG: hypothetical protein LBB88_09495, partial [Planctomycetaceae bacterium]|nr:hypothetical protein [Planctomycetaceae bacterium]